MDGGFDYVRAGIGENRCWRESELLSAAEV